VGEEEADEEDDDEQDDPAEEPALGEAENEEVDEKEEQGTEQLQSHTPPSPPLLRQHFNNNDTRSNSFKEFNNKAHCWRFSGSVLTIGEGSRLCLRL